MRTMEPLRLAIISPCFNEAQVLPLTLPRLLSLLGELALRNECSEDSYIVLVDDGSRDATWEQVASAAHLHPGRVRGIRLARNSGHQNALLAGLSYATDRCDVAISIDADLQDDLEAIPQMLSKHRAGAEIVLGIKKARAPDSLLKSLSAEAFYKGMRWGGVDLIRNHADFRLMSSKALHNLAKFPEYGVFLRGLQPLLHGQIETVEYAISPRLAGQSKYNFRRMVSLALNGVTSFSTAPLRLISLSGLFVFVISLAFAIYALAKALAGETLPGWASVTVPLYLLGGMMILSIGIVGEYVGKVFLEVKHRPRFLVDEIVEGLSEGGAVSDQRQLVSATSYRAGGVS